MTSSIRQLSKNEFPALLKEIPDPPKQLYIIGKLPKKETKHLCVVGSRKYSSYGKEVCEHLISGLRGYDIAIVSGLALGVDALAHRAALYAGLPTIGIPGSGLGASVLYPSTNRGLAKNIVEHGGALISEFEENESATPYSFPKRNRLMAGMSHATLVIEAGERSGTLITSRLATDYNREVLTVPHPIFSKTAHGPSMLLKLGATPVTGSDDILQALGIEKTLKNKNVQLKDLSNNEKRVIEFLENPIPKDELLRELNMPTQDANVLISLMEIKGIIKEQFGVLHIL